MRLGKLGNRVSDLYPLDPLRLRKGAGICIVRETKYLQLHREFKVAEKSQNTFSGEFQETLYLPEVVEQDHSIRSLKVSSQHRKGDSGRNSPNAILWLQGSCAHPGERRP